MTEENRALTLLSGARLAVEEAKTVQDLKTIRDKAEAVRQYAKQAGESLLVQNHCAEIKLRAERKAGDLLKEMKVNGTRSSGGRKNGLHHVSTSKKSKYGNLVEPPPTLKDLGVEQVEAHRWQAEAAIPEAKFDEFVEERQRVGEEITQAGLLQLARKVSGNKRGAKTSALEVLKRAFMKLSDKERAAFFDWVKSQ